MSRKATTVSQCLDVLIETRKDKDTVAEKNALCELGNAYREIDEIQYALQSYEQALTICRKIGDEVGEGSTLWNMSLTIGRLDGHVRAIDLAEAAVKIYDRISDPRADSVRKQLNEWIDSRKSNITRLEQSLSEARDEGNPKAEESILSELGDAYIDLGEIKLAIECYEQALIVGRDIADAPREGDDLWSMSLSVEKIGGHARAIDLAEAALKIYEKNNDQRAASVREKLEEWEKRTQ